MHIKDGMQSQSERRMTMDPPKRLAMESPMPKYGADSGRIDKSFSEIDSVNMGDIKLNSAKNSNRKRFSRTFHELEGTPDTRRRDQKSSVRRQISGLANNSSVYDNDEFKRIVGLSLG